MTFEPASPRQNTHAKLPYFYSLWHPAKSGFVILHPCKSHRIPSSWLGDMHIVMGSKHVWCLKLLESPWALATQHLLYRAPRSLAAACGPCRHPETKAMHHPASSAASSGDAALGAVAGPGWNAVPAAWPARKVDNKQVGQTRQCNFSKCTCKY